MRKFVCKHVRGSNTENLSASARYRLDRQHERERDVREASEHLERCRFYAENDTEMSAEEAAKLSEFRASLFAARQPRVTNGTPAPALATTAISSLSDPRQDPAALYNMRDVTAESPDSCDPNDPKDSLLIILGSRSPDMFANKFSQDSLSN